MKFIYFGTPYFSARVLQKLLENELIPQAVVTNPDRPTGRKKIMTAPPVKELMQAQGPRPKAQVIPIFQPEKLDTELIEKLKSLEPDLFVVFAYNKIFRKNILEIPRLGTIGVHPSFLPKYRGPSPFQTALLNGERETGITLYFLDEGVDSGPIIGKSEPISINPQDTFNSLALKLADAGAELLIKTLKTVALSAAADNTIIPKIKTNPQDESQATFTKKFITEDGYVSPEDLAAAEQGNAEKVAAIDRKIRALNPDPGVWTMQNGKRIKLLEAQIQNSSLQMKKIQKEGEKPKEVIHIDK